jgi:arylsulfatase A-like enzyme
MTWQGESFKGKLGFTMAESTPSWRMPPRPAEGSPNVIMIVLDDVGYGHLGCYGAPIATPNIDRLAETGLRYNNFHTTAMCSPTRACLLTGRNHHTNGLGMVSELAQGYPGYDGLILPSRGFLSEILHEKGYASYAIGKWHLVPTEEGTMSGPFDRWPLGRGFDRFYGFLGAETDQFDPDLIYDNHSIDALKEPGKSYHLTDDLTDKAIGFIRDLRVVDQTKPYFLYYCPGACHAPHQVPADWNNMYRGKFDSGWDAYRDQVYQRQLELGILPSGTELSPRPEWIKAWDSLSDEEKRMYARQMEVFAAFLSHTDHHIGRLMAAVEELGDLDNTLVMLVSDNGASGEGGYFGSFNENLFFNAIPDTLEANLEHYDEWGTEATYAHYATGWTMAGNTPFKRWKRNVFNGGIADPFIVSWSKGITARGEVRGQYSHAIDLMPTVLEILDIDPPLMLKGVPQEEIAGCSLASTFENDDAEEVRSKQYYEMYGSRAIYNDGWKAVTFHKIPGIPADGPGDADLPFVKDQWELYNVQQDFSECNDQAAQHPEKLQELIGLWFAEAGKYNVFPLHSHQMKGQRPKPYPERTTYVYYPGTSRVDNEAAVNVRMRPFSVVAHAVIPEGSGAGNTSCGAEGVLIAQGGRFAGWALFVHNGKLVYEHNLVGLERYRVTSEVTIPVGKVTLGLEFAITGQFEITPELTAMGNQGVSGQATLYINDKAVGSGFIAKTVPFGWSLSGEGLCCGFDSETPVSELYESPFRFTGELQRVVVSVSGKPYENVAMEVRKAFLAQ